jgi:hypothetical protein
VVADSLSQFLACSGGSAYEKEVVATFVAWACLIASVGLFINSIRMTLIAKDGWWSPITLGLLAALQPAVYSNSYSGDCGYAMFNYSIAFLGVAFVAWAIRYVRFSRDQARIEQATKRSDAP